MTWTRVPEARVQIHQAWGDHESTSIPFFSGRFLTFTQFRDYATLSDIEIFCCMNLISWIK